MLLPWLTMMQKRLQGVNAQNWVNASMLARVSVRAPLVYAFPNSHLPWLVQKRARGGRALFLLARARMFRFTVARDARLWHLIMGATCTMSVPSLPQQRRHRLDAPDQSEEVDVGDLPVGLHGRPLGLAVRGPAGVVHDAPQAALGLLRGRDRRELPTVACE